MLRRSEEECLNLVSAVISRLIDQELSDKEEFTDAERDVVFRFLASRRSWNTKKLQALAGMVGEKPDKWDLNNLRYARWTNGVINWLFASLAKSGGRKHASNKRGS